MTALCHHGEPWKQVAKKPVVEEDDDDEEEEQEEDARGEEEEVKAEPCICCPSIRLSKKKGS